MLTYSTFAIGNRVRCSEEDDSPEGEVVAVQTSAVLVLWDGGFSAEWVWKGELEVIE